MLRLCIEETLTGKAKNLKEIIIGIEVFGPNYDPKKRGSVRKLAGRLRKTLGRFYLTEGRMNPVVIKMTAGSYVPSWVFNPLRSLEELTDKAALLVANAMAAFDKRTLSGYEDAMRYLNDALSENKDHLRVLSLKAMVHVGRAMYGRDSSQEIMQAEKIIAQVKASDLELWEICYAEAEIRMDRYRDWKAARALFERAIELSGGEACYGPWYTAFLTSQLESEKAISYLSDAVSHASYGMAVTRADLAWCLILGGHLDEAMEMLSETIRLFPRGHHHNQLFLAILLEAMDRPGEAASAMAKLHLSPLDSTIAIGLHPLFQGLAGDLEGAQAGYEELCTIRRTGSAFIPASQLAVAAIGAGEHDAAIDWYIQASREYDPMVLWVAVYPFNRHLYRYERFREFIVKEMKLPLVPRFLPNR